VEGSCILCKQYSSLVRSANLADQEIFLGRHYGRIVERTQWAHSTTRARNILDMALQRHYLSGQGRLSRTPGIIPVRRRRMVAKLLLHYH